MVSEKSGNSKWLIQVAFFFCIPDVTWNQVKGVVVRVSVGGYCKGMSMRLLGVYPLMRPICALDISKEQHVSITSPAAKRGSCWSTAIWLGGWALRLCSID